MHARERRTAQHTVRMPNKPDWEKISPNHTNQLRRAKIFRIPGAFWLRRSRRRIVRVRVKYAYTVCAQPIVRAFWLLLLAAIWTQEGNHFRCCFFVRRFFAVATNSECAPICSVGNAMECARVCVCVYLVFRQGKPKTFWHIFRVSWTLLHSTFTRKIDAA